MMYGNYLTSHLANKRFLINDSYHQCSYIIPQQYYISAESLSFPKEFRTAVEEETCLINSGVLGGSANSKMSRLNSFLPKKSFFTYFLSCAWVELVGMFRCFSNSNSKCTQRRVSRVTGEGSLAYPHI